jgi:hypothetical protein
LQVAQPEYEVECNENGLNVRTEKGLILSHHKKSAEFTTSMDIEKVTKVTETFLGQLSVLADVDMIPDETLEAKIKVGLAREEIDGGNGSHGESLRDILGKPWFPNVCNRYPMTALR